MEKGINEKVKDAIVNSNLMIMRDKKTLKGLGVAYTEDGLRTIANKNGIYLYCQGRVNSLQDAYKAKQSYNVIVEKFIPREFNNPQLQKCEMHWIEAGYKKLY